MEVAVSNLIPFVMIASLASCASAFPYKWYGIDVDNQKLLGPKPEQDLPLSVCRGEPAQTGKCVALTSDEFSKLMEDYLEKTERLKNCEKP